MDWPLELALEGWLQLVPLYYRGSVVAAPFHCTTEVPQ